MQTFSYSLIQKVLQGLVLCVEDAKESPQICAAEDRLHAIVDANKNQLTPAAADDAG